MQEVIRELDATESHIVKYHVISSHVSVIVPRSKIIEQLRTQLPEHRC